MSTTAPVTPAPKGRKGSAAGGGKAWTEEEEVYLLQMRLQKVAYKKIATHLDKTELACRLHYHQLSHGGNRRKRTNSMSSNASEKSANSSPVQTPGSLDSSVPRSPTPRLSPVSPAGAVQKLSSNTPSKIRGKPLLPKPVDGSTPSSRKQSPAKSKQLRVNCEAGSIDRQRLQKIFEAQNKQLWISIAAQYGGPYTPEYLEAFWNNGLKSGPPTPAISPQSKVNSPIASCIPEEAATPDSLKSMAMETISELPTPQPLPTSAQSTPAPSAAPSETVPEAQVPPGSEETMTEETSQSSETKIEAVEAGADVTMSDIPEAGEPEHNWNE